MRLLISVILLLVSCSKQIPSNQIKYTVKTEKSSTDTDDPAIWYNKSNPEKSLIIGTDKDDTNGGLYVFNLKGKIVNTSLGLHRVNNVDIEYGFIFNEDTIDIAVVTERGRDQIRVFKLPELTPIDNGGIAVFENEALRKPMGLSLYKRNDGVHAIVGRKTGFTGEYLWQYELSVRDNAVVGKVVRKFGKFSGIKEIEAICVDDELGYVYYSDEGTGVRKYYADPEKGNEQLALFATDNFTKDHEGISIFKSDSTTGYILVSDQQNNTFHVFTREGQADNSHAHKFIAELPLSTNQSDGSDVISLPLNNTFKHGLFVAMSDDKTFEFFKWEDFTAQFPKNTMNKATIK